MDFNNEIFDMYSKLLDAEGIFGDKKNGVSNFDPNGEDSEEFVSLDELKHGSEEDGNFSHPSGGSKEIEEELHFKRFNRPRQHKYTEQEMEQIRESCETVIVHDYGEHDIYHMSDEERAKNDTLNELRMKLNGLKGMYHRIDEYIMAMRVAVEAWEILARDNYLHTEDEFFSMVSEGRIYSPSIIMPRMAKINRYNMDMIVKYISNPELDPTDLLPMDNSRYDSWYDQFEDNNETEEEEMERLLSPDEVQFVLDNVDNPPGMEVHTIKPKYIKGYDRTNIGKFTNSKKRKFSKKEKYMVDNLHDLLKKIQSNPKNRGETYGGRSFLVTSSIFEPEKEKKDPMDDMRYTGSWANDDDVFLYDLVAEEELMKQHPPGNRSMTYGDLELQSFFRTMEQNGMNTIDIRRRMNMSDDKLQREEMSKLRKDNKKIEAQLLQRLTKLNDNEKFKKLVGKAEKAMEKYEKDGY